MTNICRVSVQTTALIPPYKNIEILVYSETDL